MERHQKEGITINKFALALLSVLIFTSCVDESLKTHTGQHLPVQTYTISNGAQIVALNVEVATSLKERAVGLMYRKSLAENTGMLFIWPEKKQRAMWMKNTFIPLDILFIDDDTVVGIAENAQPHDLTNITIEYPVNRVLELPAGFVKKHGVYNGWKLTGNR